jgi:hypothetical protein
MIVPLVDSVTGTPVYLNPSFVMTLRPDPMDPEHVSLVKLRDGELMRIQGSLDGVAEKLSEPS